VKIWKWAEVNINTEEFINKFFLVKDDPNACVAGGSRVWENGDR